MENDALIIKRACLAFHVNQDEIKVIKRLLGGMSHLTYHIQIQDVDYTFRVIGEGGNLFVDRKTEKENLERIEPLGINNETVYFDVDTGEKAAKYVEGIVLKDTDIYPHLEKIAHVLKRLHDTDIEPSSDYCLIDRLSLYESYTGLRTPLYQRLKTIWIEKYLMHHANQPKVFCHNDAQRSNMVLSGDKLYLLDWEYAGWNEFYYDIASFGNVHFGDALALLDVYLGRKATQEERNHVRFYRMFQALQWHQVALYKEKIGLSPVLKFDFMSLASNFLELAKKLYQEIKG